MLVWLVLQQPKLPPYSQGKHQLLTLVSPPFSSRVSCFVFFFHPDQGKDRKRLSLIHPRHPLASAPLIGRRWQGMHEIRNEKKKEKNLLHFPPLNPLVLLSPKLPHPMAKRETCFTCSSPLFSLVPLLCARGHGTRPQKMRERRWF